MARRKDRRKDIVTFRHSGAIGIAVLLALFSALPLALSSWYLAPILLIPLAIGLWAIRAGVDATAEGLVVRSAIGVRRLAWPEIAGFTAAGKQVCALLPTGAAVPLPAVRPVDVPVLISVSGQELALR